MNIKNTAVLVFLCSYLVSYAQFPDMKWEYFIGAPAFGSAAAADLDEDGYYEIVFSTYTNDGRIHCLNSEDGTMKWIYDVGGCADVAPIIYDVNMDGVLDVVVNGSCNPTIFCIDGNTGTLLWSQPSGGGDSPPSIADVDNDGKPEILFGNFTGQIRSLNGEDGSVDQVIQADPFGVAVQTEPTVVDIDQDGDMEVIAASYWNNDGLHVWAFDYETAELVWTNSIIDESADFHAYHGGAMADLDGDGLLEYVIGSFSGHLRSINIEDGSDHWVVDIPESNFAAITVVDIDEDGDLEVIMNNNDWITLDERLWILSGEDGTEEWSYPIPFSSFRGFSVSDINGNGKLDLVSGHFMGGLQVVEPYTGLIWQQDLMDFFPDEPYPWFEADHQPLIADFDQNGTLDIFIVAGYGTYEPDSLNTGKAFLIEAGEGRCPEWLMFRQDIRRTGYLSTSDIEASCAITSITESVTEHDGIRIYPNPSKEAVYIEYSLDEKSKVDITVFDVLGRSVKTLESQVLSAGSYVLEWNDQLSGVFMCQIRINDKKYVERVVRNN